MNSTQSVPENRREENTSISFYEASTMIPKSDKDSRKKKEYLNQ